MYMFQSGINVKFWKKIVFSKYQNLEFFNFIFFSILKIKVHLKAKNIWKKHFFFNLYTFVFVTKYVTSNKIEFVWPSHNILTLVCNKCLAYLEVIDKKDSINVFQNLEFLTFLKLGQLREWWTLKKSNELNKRTAYIHK